MGIVDLFRNKSNQEDPSQESFETVLRKAASEPAYRPEFYKRLLTENLIVLTDGKTLPEGISTLEEDTSINIASFPDGKIPLFTSVPKIFEKGINTEHIPYLEMKGADIFVMAKGATFILNPYSDFGKELLPQEIENLLNGTIFTDTHKKLTIKKESEIRIGQPAEYPTEIVNSLKILFQTKSSVKAAYLGFIHDPSTEEPPHLIFAIDADADQMQDIVNEAGFTARQFLKADEIVDFIRIDMSGLSEYFLQTEPFYKK
ncbi:MAG TPA: enhanced serine sensitivity protein SseB C-terminal domain-containing protein [Bacteroidia bacterium]|jgi:hypothetical protein